jgi:hypothetical protein
MNNQSNIERIVMRRVHLIRILGLIISTATLAVLTFVAALWGIGREVWVAQVFQNAPDGFINLTGFYLAAFSHTHIVVQALSVLTLISLAYLARETARVISSVLTPARG